MAYRIRSDTLDPTARGYSAGESTLREKATIERQRLQQSLNTRNIEERAECVDRRKSCRRGNRRFTGDRDGLGL
jgi:hypothetical protein